MKKILLMLFGAACLTGNAQVYQIGNSDFETWSDDNEPGSGWYSFSSAGGSLNSFKMASKSTLTKVSGSEAHGGSGTSVLLQSKKVATANANGNMTTGQINMGNISPSNKSNYNHTVRGSYATQLAGTPDSIAFYGKFTRGGSGTYTGRCNAIIHGDFDYKDPYETDANAAAYKIAQATVYSTVTDTWTRYCGPFTYTGVTGDKMYILASFTTNETPGGSTGDKFYIDDVSLIYNSELVSFVYDGTTYTAASDLSTVAYDASKMGAITTNGKGATTETTYDETTGILTITVKGNDISVNASNYHSYTLQFAKPEAPKTTYNGGLVVIINGYATDPQSTDIYMTEDADGTYTLSLNNFMLGEGDEAIPVGNIVLGGLKKETAADGTETITSNQTITIADGDDPNVEFWMGSALGEVPIEFSAVIDGEKLFCNIDIDMTATLEQYINVAFAPEASVVGEQSEQPTATGSKNVILARSFSAGWNTVCLPFAFTPSEVASGAVAQAFTAVKDGALSFSAVTSCEANTPYLIYVPADVQFGKIFRGKSVVDANAQSVTYGAFTFTGVYTTEDGMSMEGKYGVATIDGVQKIRKGGASSNIFGTRAYFVSNDANANGTLIRLNDGTTGIQYVDTTTATTGVYNLQGVRVGSSLSTLPAGVYIVNGKKIIK